ncbi:MAG: hypothetical protein RLO52_04630 [Sandaracinaceae bacterium]
MDWQPVALLALAGLALVQTLRLWWVRAGDRRRRVFRAKRAQAGERDAARLLKRLGYRVLERQVQAEVVYTLDGAPEAFALRGDLLVRRSGETFLVEVKTGEREPSLRSSATRRQLLEYAHAFDVDGLLLVDATTGAVHEVRTPATRAARPRAGLGWVFAVVALGALGAWLVTRAG